MKPALARGITYGIVAALGAAALRFTPTLPQSKPVAALVAQQGAAQPMVPAPWTQRFDTLARGETLTGLLLRAGVSDSEASAAIHAASGLDARRVPAGLPVEFRTASAASSPSEIIFHLAVDHLLKLRRTAAGWTGTDEHIPWKTDTIVVSGTVHSNLYAAMDSGAKGLLTSGASRQLTWSLADIFEYKVDMSRDLQDGDSFRVLAERSTAPSGAMKVGKVLAASFTLSGNSLEAVRFDSKSGTGDYFDQNGRSMRAAFLRVPLQFRRISSVFGRREHPIFGGWRMHKGIDYAAAMGTPVRAIGDGVVQRAGWGTGFGRVLEIRHHNGFVSRYGHLSGFAKGVHVGARVTEGQTVAFVGMTGWATGPHLHFEILVDGVQRDPRIALRNVSGDPVAKSERAAFAAVRDMRLAALDAPASSGSERLASR